MSASVGDADVAEGVDPGQDEVRHDLTGEEVDVRRPGPLLVARPDGDVAGSIGHDGGDLERPPSRRRRAPRSCPPRGSSRRAREAGRPATPLRRCPRRDRRDGDGAQGDQQAQGDSIPAVRRHARTVDPIGAGCGRRSPIRQNRRPMADDDVKIERVGVVGCGLMGSGIAEVCARAGPRRAGARGERGGGRGGAGAAREVARSWPVGRQAHRGAARRRGRPAGLHHRAGRLRRPPTGGRGRRRGRGR